MNNHRVIPLLFVLLILATAVLALSLVPAAGASQNGLVPTTVTIDSGIIGIGETFTTSIDLSVPAANSLTAVTH